jgi:hypothetical protein
VKHQEKEGRRECFGVELMERDVAGGGRNQNGTGQEEPCFPIESEALPNAERHWTHRSEGGVLHENEDQWMAEDQKEGGN